MSGFPARPSTRHPPGFYPGGCRVARHSRERRPTSTRLNPGNPAFTRWMSVYPASTRANRLFPRLTGVGGAHRGIFLQCNPNWPFYIYPQKYSLVKNDFIVLRMHSNRHPKNNVHSTQRTQPFPLECVQLIGINNCNFAPRAARAGPPLYMSSVVCSQRKHIWFCFPCLNGKVCHPMINEITNQGEESSFDEHG